ncbi:DUF6894 family protein [Methylobacterium gnaphalii]|uniref:DUF6894 family protein n=1 Tax=Methylobacterium gnaphalii TaxID=1010610 RepID=UPI0035A247F8
MLLHADDGECATTDKEDIALADDKEARAWAARLLTEMVEAAGVHQDPSRFEITVRDERGVFEEKSAVDGSLG